LLYIEETRAHTIRENEGRKGGEIESENYLTSLNNLKYPQRQSRVLGTPNLE
jgi:hypothetical protein